MIKKEKCIVIDVDGTLCSVKKEGEEYCDLKPKKAVVNKINEYKKRGFYIILYTSRNMRTYEGNMGLIQANTAKVLIEWLDKNKIVYDELHFGKPWSGFGGFYVDDKAVRPDEFVKLDYKQIMELIK